MNEDEMGNGSSANSECSDNQIIMSSEGIETNYTN